MKQAGLHKQLISIYESKKDYDAIVALRESAKDASVFILKAFLLLFFFNPAATCSPMPSPA